MIEPVLWGFGYELVTSLFLSIAGLFAFCGNASATATPMQRDVDVIYDLVKANDRISNRNLAQLAGCSEAKASRHVKQLTLEGRLVKCQNGRSVALTVAS